jgi:hypothetical protein
MLGSLNQKNGPCANTGLDSGQNPNLKITYRQNSSSDNSGNLALLRLACAALTVEEIEEWLANIEGEISLHPSEMKTLQLFWRWTFDLGGFFQNEEEH